MRGLVVMGFSYCRHNNKGRIIKCKSFCHTWNIPILFIIKVLHKKKSFEYQYWKKWSIQTICRWHGPPPLPQNDYNVITYKRQCYTMDHYPIPNNDLLSCKSFNITQRVRNIFHDMCSCLVRAREHMAPYAPLFGTVCSLFRHWMRGRKLFPGGHPSKY